MFPTSHCSSVLENCLSLEEVQNNSFRFVPMSQKLISYSAPTNPSVIRKLSPVLIAAILRTKLETYPQCKILSLWCYAEALQLILWWAGDNQQQSNNSTDQEHHCWKIWLRWSLARGMREHVICGCLGCFWSEVLNILVSSLMDTKRIKKIKKLCISVIMISSVHKMLSLAMALVSHSLDGGKHIFNNF